MCNNIVIVIQHCLDEGLQSKFTSCDGYDRNVTDMRNFLKYTNGTDLIHAIKFEKDCWIMCCIQPDPSANSGSGYRAAWVFFPVAVNVSQKEIDEVITVAEEQIKCNEYDVRKLKYLVEKYSQIKESVSYDIPLFRNGIALRYVGDGQESLYDIYDKIYQKEFTRYEWVILMNRTAANAATCSSLQDITAKPLRNSHIISIRENDFGFVPYGNGQRLCNPIRITDNEPLEIVWRKEGYCDIKKSGTKEPDFEINKNDYVRIFRVDLIKTYDAERGCPLNNVHLNFNSGCHSQDGKEWYIKESDVSRLTVTVSADNYETQTIPLNLSGQVEVKPIEVRLCPQKHIYVFKIPLSNGKYITTESYTSQKLLTECPIEGYKCQDRIQEGMNYVRFVGKKEAIWAKSIQNREVYNEGQCGGTHHKPGDGDPHNPKPKKKKWYKGLFNLNTLVLFVIAFVVGALCYVGYKWFFADNESPMEYTSVVPESVEDKSTWEAARAYLDSCQNVNQAKWIESEMEQYGDLKGLYKHINNYEFTEIVSILNRHKDDFMKYDEYKRLYEIASRNKNKKGQFSNDGTITFDNYLRRDFASMNDANMENTPGNETNKDEPEKQQEQHSPSKTGQNRSASKTSKGSTTTNQGNNQDNNI